jgi:hypothetical protein
VAQGRGVRDQWLINVLEDTVSLWKKYPDSPQASLSTDLPKILPRNDDLRIQATKSRLFAYEDQPVIVHPGEFDFTARVYTRLVKIRLRSGGWGCRL